MTPLGMSHPRKIRLRRLVRLYVDRREVFVIAVGVERLDPQQINSRLSDPKLHTSPDPAAWLEVHLELLPGHHPFLEVGHALLPPLLLAHDIGADRHILLDPMR